MEKIVVNNFTFPNNIAIRCVIAKYCKELVASSGPRTERSWTWIAQDYFTYNTVKEGKIKDYFSTYAEESAHNKLWRSVSDQYYNYRIEPNEYTATVAEMYPKFEEERKKTTQRNFDYKKKRILKKFEDSALIRIGDIVKLNRNCWELKVSEYEFVPGDITSKYYFSRVDPTKYSNYYFYYEQGPYGLVIGEKFIGHWNNPTQLQSILAVQEFKTNKINFFHRMSFLKA